MNFNNRERFAFGDITEIIFSGGTPSTRVDKYWGGDINWLSSGETRNNFINTTEKTITKEGVKNSSTRLAIKDDIVMASAGQGFTRGQVSYLHIDTYINQSIIAIRPNPNILNNLYAYYNLKNRYEELRAMSDGHSIRGSITIPMIKELEIDLPPILEQKEVANILHSLDKKIEGNNKINTVLEEIAQTLYKQWFVDFEFPNEEGNPYKSNGGEMIETEIGEIPLGWKISTIDKITTYNKRGFSPLYTDNDEPIGIQVINQRCVRNHTIIEETVRYHDLNKKNVPEDRFHKAWDVLINSMGVGTLGRVAISSTSHNKIVHSVITILRPNTKIMKNAIFSYAMLNLENIFMQMGEGSTGQTSLSNKYLGQLKIVVPPIHIQEKLEPTIKTIQKMIDKNHKESEKLANIRDLLLPILMSGEIRVPVEE